MCLLWASTKKRLHRCSVLGIGLWQVLRRSGVVPVGGWSARTTATESLARGLPSEALREHALLLGVSWPGCESAGWRALHREEEEGLVLGLVVFRGLPCRVGSWDITLGALHSR